MTSHPIRAKALFSDRRHPQAVNVAELIDGHYVLLSHAEFGIWRIRGVQIFEHAAGFSLDINPHDVMHVNHGMCDTAHLHMQFAALKVEDGDMLLGGAIGRINREQFELFVTALWRGSAHSEQNGGTTVAAVKLSVCHNGSSFHLYKRLDQGVDVFQMVNFIND